MTIDDEPTLTLDAALALVAQASDGIVSTVLKHVEAECIAQGFSPPAVAFLIDEYARVLAAGRAQRLETARAMLEHHCAHLH